jgi:hypothetical protein
LTAKHGWDYNQARKPVASTGDARTAQNKIGWWAALALAGVLLLVLAVPLARFVTLAGDWLPYPYPRAGSEGLILYESYLVKRGGDIYAPITPERFISGPYPPVYYWLNAWLLPDTPPDFSTPGAVSSAFTPGRLLSLFSAILAALFAAVTVFHAERARGEKKLWWPALAGGTIGGLLFLAMPQAVVWSTRLRGDMLMVAFTVAGLACVAAGSRSAAPQSESEQAGAHNRRRYVILGVGALLFALAFYTKQTALAGPVAATLFLLLRDWRLGLRWTALMAVLVGLPFVILEIATGHWFYLKMVDYHSLPLRAGTLSRLLEYAFWEDSWPLILVALAFAAYRLTKGARRRRGGDEGREESARLLVPLFLLAALLFMPTGAVIGADHNHLLIPGLALALAVGAACAELLNYLAGWRRGGDWRVPVPAAVAGALLLVFALVTSPPATWYDPDLTVPGPAVQEQLRLIVQNVRSNPGDLFFADDPGIIALAGKETPYDDPFTMTALALGSRWDESAFRRMLSQGRFNLIVLSCNVIEAPDTCRYDTLTPGAADAIRAGYTVLFRDVLFTFAPKGP